jgi:hypothetical protein
MLVERSWVKNLKALTAHNSNVLTIVSMKSQRRLVVMQKTHHGIRIKTVISCMPQHFSPAVCCNPVVISGT